MIHITHHSLDRLATRTDLTPIDVYNALSDGTQLNDMPYRIKKYITKRLHTYDLAIYRLYSNTILIYRPNTYIDTKTTRPMALITVLIIPDYLLYRCKPLPFIGPNLPIS